MSKYYTTISNCWRAPRPVEPNPLQQSKTINVEDVREQLGLEIENHFVSKQPGLLVVSVCPGIGKSTITTRVTENVSTIFDVLHPKWPTRIALFSPRHDQFSSVEKDKEWLHVKGRYGISENGSSDDGNCQYAKLANEVGKKGWRVSKTVCFTKKTTNRARSICELRREECTWWNQWSNATHRFMPIQHIHMLPLLCRLSDQIVVFDDVDIQHLVPGPVRFSLIQISRCRDIWPKLATTLDPLVEFTYQQKADNFIADVDLYEKISAQMPNKLHKLSKSPSIPAPPETDEKIEEWAQTLPDGRLGKALEQLREEVERFRQGEKFVSRIAVSNKELVFYPKPEIPNEIFELPTVLLNATPFLPGFQEIFQKKNYSVKDLDFNVGLHPDTTITYVLDRNHSKSAVRNNLKYRQRWLEMINRHASMGRRTLIVATLEGESVLKDEFAQVIARGRVAIAHYGALSGLNEYEEFDTVILSQPYTPSPVAAAELYRILYGGVEGDPLDLHTAYRTEVISDEDSGYDVHITTLADERLRPIYEHLRQSEMLQAAHRVRPLLHPRTIVIASAVPVSGLPPTDVNYSSRSTVTLSKIIQAAKDVIKRNGFVVAQQIAEYADVSVRTVYGYWDRLKKYLNADEIPVLVPSERYPTGRWAKALSVSRSQRDSY